MIDTTAPEPDVDVVLAEDGRTVCAYIYDDVRDDDRVIELGRLDEPADDDFDRAPWRDAAALVGNFINTLKEA